MRAVIRRSSGFLLGLLVQLADLAASRQETLTDDNHVKDTGNRDRNTDPSEFEETEARHADVLKSTGSEDIRRRTNQSDDTAHAAAEGHRHQLTLRRNLRGGADTLDNRQQGSSRRGVGQERGQQRAGAHTASHDTVLGSTRKPNNLLADFLRDARMEHRRADDEHTGKQDDRGVRETGEYRLDRNQARKTDCDTASHRGNRQRQQFRHEEERDDCHNHQTLYSR